MNTNVTMGVFAGFLLGIGATLVERPTKILEPECSTYKVDEKAVVSYVLKAPEKPAEACPKAEPVKCPVVKSEPPEAKSDEPEEKPKRKRRHGRMRMIRRAQSRRRPDRLGLPHMQEAP